MDGSMVMEKMLQVGSSELSSSVRVETFNPRGVCNWQPLKAQALEECSHFL